MWSFEGPEKKFEIVTSNSSPSLRKLGDEAWSKVVEISNARVLSKISNSTLDAYLLSESSLFVFDHRAIMITCGQTALINGLFTLLDMIKDRPIEALFFERKNENFPHLQLTSFDDDVTLLRPRLPGATWNLGNQDGHFLSLYCLDKVHAPEPDDQSLEVLMYGLDPNVLKLFKYGTPREALFDYLKLEMILPGFVIDDHFFKPSGYSLNALNDQHYYTIHVTPQNSGSYASFETNLKYKSPADINRVIDVLTSTFKPQKFDVVYFDQNRHLNYSSDTYQLDCSEFRRLVCGYGVDFSHFVKRGIKK